MQYQEIKILLQEQREDFLSKDIGVLRDKLIEIKKYLKNDLAIIISGVRRCGKSTLLRQIAKYCFSDQGFYYLNFEDERFIDFQAKDFNQILEVLYELYGEQKVFFIDEVQNIKSWELFIRRLIDNGYKFFITGSNSELLSKELGSRLTGRYLALNLFPFGFSEYLKFNNLDLKLLNPTNTKEKAEVIRTFNTYLKEGGLPASLKIKDNDFNQTLYENIIYRDIISRYKITSEDTIKSLSFYLANNISSLFTYNKLKEGLHIGNITTVKNYVLYLENAWLFFTINIFSPSLKRQQIAPKKVYIIDPGFIKNIGVSEKLGQSLENLVFLYLKKIYEDVYYYKTKNDLEVDFFIPSKKLLCQSCFEISNKNTLDRELSALLKAMDELKIKESFIITHRDEEKLSIENKTINIIPAYKLEEFIK